MHQGSEVAQPPRRWSAWPSTLLAAASTAVAAESVHLGLGSATQPGPGFFPFWLSVLLTLAALALALQRAKGLRALPVGQPSPSAGTLAASAKIFLVLCLYTALLIPLGFIPATPFFFSLEIRIIEQISWRRALVRGLLATAAAYGLFALLGVQLPSGLWLR